MVISAARILLLVDCELRVVALDRLAAVALDDAAVEVGEVDQAAWGRRGLVRLDHPGGHPARAVGRDPAQAPGFIGGMRGVLRIELFLQAAARVEEPISPLGGDRPRFARPPRIQRAATFPDPGATALGLGHERRRIEVEVRRVQRSLFGGGQLLFELLLGLAQRAAPTLAGA